VNLALTVLEIVAPVFLLAGIGFVWVRLGFEYRVQFVTRLAMTLSVPCLIFTALMQSEVSPSALTALAFASLGAYSAITLVTAIGLKLAKLEQRTYLSPVVFGNTGNLGLPLALFAFGADGLGLAVVVFAIMAILSFTVWLSLIKLVLCAGLAWITGRAFGLSDMALGVLVMQIATPVAVTSYLLAEKYGADADAVAGLVVVSTLISVAALPLLLALLL